MLGIVSGVIFSLNRNYSIFRIVSSESCLYKTVKCWFRPSVAGLPLRLSRYHAEQEHPEQHGISLKTCKRIDTSGKHWRQLGK
jgi:hypothetical protein